MGPYRLYQRGHGGAVRDADIDYPVFSLVKSSLDERKNFGIKNLRGSPGLFRHRVKNLELAEPGSPLSSPPISL
jgi:hypothetical protein